MPSARTVNAVTLGTLMPLTFVSDVFYVGAELPGSAAARSVTCSRSSMPCTRSPPRSASAGRRPDTRGPTSPSSGRGRSSDWRWLAGGASAGRTAESATRSGYGWTSSTHTSSTRPRRTRSPRGPGRQPVGLRSGRMNSRTAAITSAVRSSCGLWPARSTM